MVEKFSKETEKQDVIVFCSNLRAEIEDGESKTNKSLFGESIIHKNTNEMANKLLQLDSKYKYSAKFINTFSKCEDGVVNGKRRGLIFAGPRNFKK